MASTAGLHQWLKNQPLFPLTGSTYCAINAPKLRRSPTKQMPRLLRRPCMSGCSPASAAILRTSDLSRWPAWTVYHIKGTFRNDAWTVYHIKGTFRNDAWTVYHIKSTFRNEAWTVYHIKGTFRNDAWTVYHIKSTSRNQRSSSTAKCSDQVPKEKGGPTWGGWGTSQSIGLVAALPMKAQRAAVGWPRSREYVFNRDRKAMHARMNQHPSPPA